MYTYGLHEVLYNRTRYNTEDLLNIIEVVQPRYFVQSAVHPFDVTYYTPAGTVWRSFAKECGLPLCVRLRGGARSALGLVSPTTQVGLDPLVYLAASLVNQAPRVMIQQIVLALASGPFTKRSDLAKSLAWADAFCARHHLVLRVDEKSPSVQETQIRWEKAQEAVRCVQARSGQAAAQYKVTR